MNKKIEIGKINQLKIDRFTTPGAFLVAEDGEDVLLPNKYVTEEMDLDDIVDVFIYTDSEDRLVASTKKPYAIVDEFGHFEIVAVQHFGAFAKWGLEKDLFIPKSCQKREFRVGDKKILRVTIDPKHEMIIGDEKVGRYLTDDVKDLKEQDKVKCLVLGKTPLGYKVIVENQYEGTIFENEVYENIKVGNTKFGFIKKIRFDGKLDISLREVGENKDKKTEDLILHLLSKSPKIPYTYKTDPELVKKIFKTSRKGFKRALTSLINQEKIEVVEDGIVLK